MVFIVLNVYEGKNQKSKSSYCIKVIWNSSFNVHNKVLLEYSHTYSGFTYGWFPATTTGLSNCVGDYRVAKPKYLLTGSLEKKIDNP